MKKINLKGLEMELLTETLENGLRIFMLPYSNKKNYFISYATHYGSDVLEFTDEDEKTQKKPPLGVAHFLEHKMFEQASGEDPFAFFSKSGTDSNADTSYNSTEYICMGNKEFEKNLQYLLEFVNAPYYTDENVEKEKGIIAEEIKMYNDIPDYQLEMKLRECLYKNHPRRIDIAGTVEEIEKITKEDLYACYNNFYVPNNMVLLIVGHFSPEKALKIVRDVVGEKEMRKLPKVKVIEEQDKVNQKECTLKENIEIPKIAYGLKIPTKKFKMKEIELDYYLSMLTTILFGSSSEFREEVRQEQLSTEIYTEWEKIDGFRVFYIMAITSDPKEFKKKIEKHLDKKKINEKAMNRIKKVWIANEVRRIDNIDATISSLYHDVMEYGDIIPNKIDLIKGLKSKTLKEIVEKIDFQNSSTVQMYPKKD